MDIKLIEVGADKVVRFKLSTTVVTGMEKLVQIVVLTLMDVPGKSVLFPEAGGAIPSLIGQNIDINDPNEILADITNKVRKTQSEIIDNQLLTRAIPSERLRELRIMDLRQGASLDQIFLRLRIVNEAGRQVDVIV